MGKKLVIGSSGQIGTELIHTLTNIHGENQVVATDIYPKHEGKHDGVLFLKMDVLDSIHLAGVVKEYEVSEVYLLAALLSAVSESKIKSAWDLNMNGLFNVLELARQGQIKKVFWPSSIVFMVLQVLRKIHLNSLFLSLIPCTVSVNQQEKDGVIIITKNLMSM